MSGTIFTMTLPQPPVNIREVLGYMGCRTPSAEMTALANECVALATDIFDFRLCYGEFPLIIRENAVDFGFTSVESLSLSRHLKDCTHAILFGATVGLEIDRLITRYGRLSPAKGLCLQALGAERIETLCDGFCHHLATHMTTRNCTVTSRFSPGYGDLPLALQKDIFAVLDCPRRIGLSLNESLLMSPSKSVTAIIGIKEKKEEAS